LEKNMSIIEARLEGRQATLEALASFIHRHLPHGPFHRIEVQLSSHAKRPLDRITVQHRVIALLKAHGHPQAAISVRPFDNRLDDALGANQVRLIPVPSESTQGQIPHETAQSPFAKAWRQWARLLGIRGGGQTSAPPSKGQPSGGPQVHAASDAPPPLPARDAAKLYDRAILLAAASWPAQQRVGRAKIVVRNLPLHRAMRDLVEADLAGAERHIRDRLRKADLNLADPLLVTYRFEPPAETQGTVYLAESDLEVQLDEPQAASVWASGATLMPKVRATSEQVDVGTLLPTAHRTAETQVRVRALGTTDGLLNQPIDLGLHALPLTIHRQWLMAQGLGRMHPDWLRTVSAHLPLRVESLPDGGWTLDAAQRPQADGAPSALYHRYPDGLALAGVSELNETTVRVCLNHPDGLADPATGSRVGALVLELESITSA
jgi:hypothetical protein